MSKVLLYVFVVVLLVGTGCRGNQPVQEEYINTPLPATSVSTPDSSKITGLTASPQKLPALPNVASTMGALNPAHGKPGHRCDIEVGAPLSSPAKPAASMQTTAPSLPAPAPPLNINSSGALNPAHGKPGHRCDISVGAPLNSPVQAAPTEAKTQLPTQVPPPLPQPTNNALGKGRLNPAHGQPGHDCAVPVGQPLKS